MFISLPRREKYYATLRLIDTILEIRIFGKNEIKILVNRIEDALMVKGSEKSRIIIYIRNQKPIGFNVKSNVVDKIFSIFLALRI